MHYACRKHTRKKLARLEPRLQKIYKPHFAPLISFAESIHPSTIPMQILSSGVINLMQALAKLTHAPVHPVRKMTLTQAGAKRGALPPARGRTPTASMKGPTPPSRGPTPPVSRGPTQRGPTPPASRGPTPPPGSAAPSQPPQRSPHRPTSPSHGA